MNRVVRKDPDRETFALSFDGKLRYLKIATERGTLSGYAATGEHRVAYDWNGAPQLQGWTSYYRRVPANDAGVDFYIHGQGPERIDANRATDAARVEREWSPDRVASDDPILVEVVRELGDAAVQGVPGGVKIAEEA